MRIAFLILLAGVLAGCAEPLWLTDTYDERRFLKDRYECQRDATYPGAGVIFGPEIDMPLFKACMTAKGYRLTYR